MAGMQRWMALLVAALTPISSSIGAEPPALPRQLSALIVKDRFEPGDFSWLRGRFPGATAEQRARWAALKNWADAQAAYGKGQALAQLRTAGIAGAEATLEDGCYGDMSCNWIRAAGGTALKIPDWAAFETALKEVRPPFDAYLTAVLTIRSQLPRLGTGTPLAEKLHNWVIVDQAWRSALQRPDDPRGLKLSANGIIVFNLFAAAEAVSQDLYDTKQLKAVIAENGWPTKSLVGDVGSRDAWLLVQHADADPAFQLAVLRMIEPLAAKGEVSAANHAYLYDRVMLKLAGRQRYGTQMQCESGKYRLRPLEQADKLDEWRTAAGLEPIATYAARFDPTCRG
jgi:hypothetical protein